MTSSRRRSRRLLAAGVAAVMVGGLLAACGDDGDDGIAVENARAVFTTGDVGAVYFDLVNPSERGDELVAASSAIADEVHIHEVHVEEGAAIMRPKAGGIHVPAGGTVVLQPGDVHLMLLGVEEIPEQGDTFELTLTFVNGGPMRIAVTVERIGLRSAGSSREDVHE